MEPNFLNPFHNVNKKLKNYGHLKLDHLILYIYINHYCLECLEM